MSRLLHLLLEAQQIDQPVASVQAAGMSAASDHVLIQLTIDSSGLQRQGFGELAILSHSATWPERIRRYTSYAAAVPSDWAADSPEARAIAAAFAQEPSPATVAVVRATGTLTQRYDIAVPAGAAAAGTTYTINVKGKGVVDTTVSYAAQADLAFASTDISTGSDTIAEPAHGMLTGAGPFRLATTGTLPAGTGIAVDTNVWIIASSANTYQLATSKANALALSAIDITGAGSGSSTLIRARNDTIIAQLVQGMNAVSGANYTAAQVTGSGETDTMSVIGTAPNNWFSLQVTNPAALSNAQTHAAPVDVLLATDLANILAADSGWYCLITLYNSTAYVLAAAAWVESNGRIYAVDTVDTQVETVAAGSGTEIGAQLLALGYARTCGVFYSAPAIMEPAGWMGRWLPTDPGKANSKFKTLAGVPGEPSLGMAANYKVNIRARRMNSYEQVLPDRAFAWEGFVFSSLNKFIDVTRNGDWLQDQAQKALLEVMIENDIVPYSPDGISLLGGALRGVGSLAETQGVLLPGWSVITPVFALVQATDEQNRNLRGLKLFGHFRNPINTVIPVSLVLTL